MIARPGRPISPVAPPTVTAAPAQAAERGVRRLSDGIDRAIASTVALEFGARDPEGRLRVATGVVINDRGEVLSIRVAPPDPASTSTGVDGRMAPGRPEIRARDAAGHIHPAHWIAADALTGLTLLRIEAEDIRPIGPGAREPVLGDEVVVIGTPYGLIHSVSRGHVAGLSRQVLGDPWPLGGLIQVQAPLHPGDSGALLADLDGNWLGLVRGVVDPLGEAPRGSGPRGLDDLGFAITAADARWVAGRLHDLGRVDRAYLGVRFGPEAAAPAAPSPGVEVTEVLEGSPARRGGLLVGDRIVGFDGRPIRTLDDLTDRLDRTPADAEVVVDLHRPGSPGTLARTVRTAARIALAAAPATPGPKAAPRPEPAPPSPAPPVDPGPLLERIERLERRIGELERRDPRSASAP